ncbi:hypothetical protein HMI55_005617 [Coelomomyces lativittatus]|nr:hypothetical protein HMI55_005617 [Coelomomyces lativittatus]
MPSSSSPPPPFPSTFPSSSHPKDEDAMAMEAVEEAAVDEEEEEEEEEGVTALDVLQEEAWLDETSFQRYTYRCDACTFQLGYVTQWVYVCRTCGLGKGVCYSCHIMCHADHDILELDAKRDFRCDCYQFGHCQLQRSREAAPHSSSSSSSSLNTYSQNFYGLYCVCHQPYDPSLDMYLCYHCQDWFHPMCLKQFPETNKDGFVDLLCEACVSKFPHFLHFMTPSSSSPPNLICFSKPYHPTVLSPVYLPPQWRDQLCTCTEVREGRISFFLF